MQSLETVTLTKPCFGNVIEDFAVGASGQRCWHPALGASDIDVSADSSCRLIRFLVQETEMTIRLTYVTAKWWGQR